MSWPNTNRAGLLGQAGPLTAVSQASRTSPTARGVFVLTRFFGIDAPNPPANVPALAERPGNPAGTLRERMMAHKLNPSCANCHALFDPLGLALENFDAIGAWRTTDGGSPIDASGAFIDGTRFNGPAEFRAGLLRYREAYYAGVTRQLLASRPQPQGKGPGLRLRDASGPENRPRRRGEELSLVVPLVGGRRKCAVPDEERRPLTGSYSLSYNLFASARHPHEVRPAASRYRRRRKKGDGLMAVHMRMVSLVVMLVGVLAGGWTTLRAGQATEQRPASAPASSAVGAYCAGCHNGVMRSPSGALLDQFDATRIAENPDVWTRAYRQLQAGTMPPVGARRPDRGDLRRHHPIHRDGAARECAARGRRHQPGDRRRAWPRSCGTARPTSRCSRMRGADRLIRPAVLKNQIRRMLADERARAFVKRFFFPWLGLDRLEKADPDKSHFPDYDASLRDAMATETELFILNQLREDRDPVELWSANVTFLNEQLARHYGVPNVTGAQFRPVVDAPRASGSARPGQCPTW